MSIRIKARIGGRFMSELFCKEYLTDLSLIPLTFTYANVRYKGLKEGFEGIKVSSRA